MEAQSGKNKLFGPMMIALGGIAWSFSGVLGKGLLWNGFSKAGFRGILAAVAFGCLRKSFRVQFNKSLILGSLGVALTSLLYMCAVQYTTSANAIVLQYSMPVYVILLNFLVFRQKPVRRDVITILFVLTGVVLCCIEGLKGGGMLGNIIALLSGLSFALVFFASRLPGADAMSYSYFGNVISIPMALFMLFDPNVHFTPTETVTSARIFMDFLQAGALGVSLFLGYWFFSLGVKRTGAVTSAIISNLEPVLNPVWVFVFLKQSPGIYGILGALIVLVTVTLHSVLPRKTR